MNKNITTKYWMEMTDVVAKASTCRVNVGCIIVRNNYIVGMGYVGSVHGGVHCNEVGCLFVDNPVAGSGKTEKSCIRTIHAEMNAILNMQQTVRGNKTDGWLTAYCSYQPCLNCTKALYQIGTRRIFYHKLYYDEWRDLFVDSLQRDGFLVIEQFHK